MRIPYNKPTATAKEFEYIRQAIENGHISGDGPFSRRAHQWLVEHTGTKAALLTHSGTAALEMIAILAGVGEGDEVIMPSYTFVSTANAFVLRGATPVFVDVTTDTLTVDPEKVEAAVTKKTRAIVAVHYAGVAAAMDELQALSQGSGAMLLEDAAQALGASYRQRPLGTLGTLGALSFHETKNIIAGEGGALLINDHAYQERAEIIREKGTDRSKFFRGVVDKYTWVDIGSSFLPSDMIAAFLLAQLERSDELLAERLSLWDRYHRNLARLEASEWLRRPVVPEYATHNGHIYYVLLPTAARRDEILAGLRTRGIGSVFHYIPLHSSPAGRQYGRTHGTLAVTDDVSSRILRLPMYSSLSLDAVDDICNVLEGLM